jgi:hypothetical protein
MGGAAGIDLAVEAGRFTRGGQPFYPVGNFLTAQGGNGPRTHTYLSEQHDDLARQGMIDLAVANGYNTFSIYTYNEGDYGGVGLSPFSGNGFGGSFDDAKLLVWRQRVEALLDAGLHPIVWLVPDDSPGIAGASNAALHSYFDRMVTEFDDLPVLWVMALEVDEYWGLARCEALGGYLASIATHPVSVHQLSGESDCMAKGWTDFASYQYGFGKSWQQVFDDTVTLSASLGDKPLIAFEYDLDGGDNDERLGLAAAFGGAEGVGNGAPGGLAAFMQGLPTGMQSSRGQGQTHLIGGGVSASADMTTLTFSVTP